MRLPVFVKGHLNFKVDNKDFEFIHQNISVFGVAGLPWGTLNPRDHFGKEVTASIRITSPEALSVLTQARILRESTASSEFMGLKFYLQKEARDKLSALISKHGFYPTEYLRKYPRIVASAVIQTFPLRAVAFPDPENTDPDSTFKDPLIFEVGNLSPSGILLHTENQSALIIQPGDKIRLLLEPRGWFPMSIRMQGLICRVSDELSPVNGNLTRHLGVKFIKADDVNQTAFLDLLKDILSKVKVKPG